MIKYISLLLIFFNLLFAFKIEAVEDRTINDNKESYIKDGRLVLNPMANKLLKTIDMSIIKSMDIKVLKPLKNKILEPYNPVLAKKKAIEAVKTKKIAIAKKEAVKKQFATKIDLKAIPEVKKEDIKVDKESTDFFNSLNEKDTKPVDME